MENNVVNASFEYERLKTLQHSYNEKLKEINKIEKEKLELKNNKFILEKLIFEKENLFKQIKEWEKSSESLVQLKKLDKEKELQISKKNELSEQIKKINSELLQIEKKIGWEESRLEKAEQTIKEFDEIQIWCTAYEYYDKAMGKSGISCSILSEQLETINREISNILTEVVNFGVHIEYDESNQTIPLYLTMNGKTRPLELASGAQKFIASLAIRVALLKITNLPKCSTFIIDEGFGKLDSNNIENISKIFNLLRTEFENIILISHLDMLKDMVDNIIDITNENGFAKVQV